ncbi:MAG: ABC transporter ATP-binding protein [Clostridium sp.]|nr:ABC transporter ATP-binding protein [Clostridium sp.]MCM1173267.1 ABC transporter ATP-binding protein [Clostridium sp.]MCM1236195.1 ABC transporter ATP-binding protein [Ruminococcus flavefaciens]
MSEYVLEMNHITKAYPDGGRKNVVLNDVSLKVKRGEFIAIIGPSGSGKSTFLTIAGLLLSPDAGSVEINGKNLLEDKKKKWTRIRKEHIGFIFQNHQLLPYLKAKEQLSMFQAKENRSKVDVDAMFEELGITECKAKYPSELSGGQKQRIAIARAFVNDPNIILADEPTASLDREMGRQVVEMMRMEVKKYNKAAVMVTHDERVLNLVDKVYCLEDGELRERNLETE